MRIRKYDFNYGRRELMKKIGAGVGAGVLAPLWSGTSTAADISKAYPDELLSIEGYTKGKINTGDFITANNVDVVKDLLDPVNYIQVKEHGRKIKIRASSHDVSTMFPHHFLEASLRNKGKAMFGKDGNVYTKEGKPWIGGAPFLDSKDGLEAMANLTLSWGKADYTQYAIIQKDIGANGEQEYQYEFIWSELQANNRIDGKTFKDPKLLRYQVVLFTSTQDVAGSSFLSIWYYDQRKFPDLYGYLPQFKRVRQFPTNQRFEPLIPGATWFLSDAWAAGDPMMTWGNYKLIGRKPMLMAMSGNWAGKNKNWEKNVHGGPKSITFQDTEFELCPEVMVVESEPVGYPRSPVGKKHVWIDARNGMFGSYIRYDRNGKPWVNFEAGSGQYIDGDKVLKARDGKPQWSWTYVMSYDVQSKRMSRADHTESCLGGYKSLWETDKTEEVYDKFFTQQAITRLGSV